jgi:ribosome maturation factor RimP
MMKETEAVKSLLTPVLEKEGFELAEVTLTRDKDGLTLHIFVDRDEPISLDDIVRVSDIINPILDQEDPVDGPYVLDVSSLGLEKPLKLEKLPHYVGKYVNLHLSHPFEGENTLEGDLLEVNEEEVALGIKIKARKKTIRLKRDAIDKARLAIKF